MKIIILAAGRGNRMLPLTETVPKPLLRIGSETIIGRLLRQLRRCSHADIVIVVGHKKEKIYDEIKKTGITDIKIIENPIYSEDINIYSLYLAVSQGIYPFVVIEGDIIFEDDCIKYMLDQCMRERSIWFTNGYFQNWQYGGILKSDKQGQILDIQIVKKYQEKYKVYKKLVGVTKVGEKEINTYYKALDEYCKKGIKQYYLTPWIENLERLTCSECDLSNYKVISINTPFEYKKTKNLFN